MGTCSSSINYSMSITRNTHEEECRVRLVLVGTHGDGRHKRRQTRFIETIFNIVAFLQFILTTTKALLFWFGGVEQRRTNRSQPE